MDDKMKTYPNFVTIFKQKMGNIHAAKSGSSNLIEMNKILLGRMLSAVKRAPTMIHHPPHKNLNPLRATNRQKNYLEPVWMNGVKEFKSFF